MEETKAKVEAKVEKKEEVVKIREDLNNIVSSFKWQAPQVDYRGNVRPAVLNVFFGSGVSLEFNDKDGVYDLIQSFLACGNKDAIVSRKLVEREKNAKVDLSEDIEEEEGVNTYFCVEIVIKEADKLKTYRLFARKRFVARRIIENYYSLYKKNQKK